MTTKLWTLYLSGIVCFSMSACGGGRIEANNGGAGPSTSEACAVARTVQSDADLVGGPLARGRTGDLVIENGQMRIIVQKPGRNWLGIAQFGGNIIDASLKAADGSVSGNDQFEEFILGTNVESSPNYQTVEVIDSGGRDEDGNCKPAVIRATGPDDLFEIVNASSIIRQISVGGVPLQYPPSADDVDLPLSFETDYTLNAGQRYIRVDTRMINDTDNPVDLYLTEYINASGELEYFRNGYGFGEPFVTAACDSCNFVVMAGHEGGAGTSYGLIHDVASSTTVTAVGVAVILYGRDFLDVATTPEGTHPLNPNSSPNYTVPAGGSLTHTRYFAVGDGTVASILESRNRISGLSTGTLSGTVSDRHGPVQNAEIAVLTSEDDFALTRGPALRVVNHFRTGSDGRFSASMPIGEYELRLNVPGRLAGTPSTTRVRISADQETVQDFAVPAASGIRVLVTDTAGNPLPAKIQLIGSDSSPDAGEPQNSETVLQALQVRSGVFGDVVADPLPPGIVLAEFAVKDPGQGPVTLGDTGVLPVEPGDYILSVSRGMRYNAFSTAVTIVEGETLTVAANLAEVIEIPNHLAADFHVHSFQSLDAEVTDRERIATYLSEGLDFFTPSDHGFRADFRPLIADMAVGRWIATAPSAEMTTQDYGHYNAWPTAIERQSPSTEAPGLGQSDDPKTSQGSVDWGGAAPVGMDFPEHGHFSLAPQQIVAESHRDPLDEGREVVVQINHVEGFFGPSGLGIDTGLNPPVSSVDPSSRRLDPDFVDPDPDIGPGNYYTDSYDSLELWIGTSGVAGQTSQFMEQNLGDWFNLLNQGRFHTGVANSDTHDRRITALHTRNIVSVPAGLRQGNRVDPERVAADPHTVADSVLEGLTTMTNAPRLVVKATNLAGQGAGLELSDRFGPISRPLPLASPGDAISIDLLVQSATWAEFDRIAIYQNGRTVRHVNELGLPIEPARYRTCGPVAVLNAGTDFSIESIEVPNTGGARRLQASIDDITLVNSGSDYWFIVMAEGTPDVSRPLWPVVPNDFVEGDRPDIRSTADRGVYALAVSNPIYVDADNNGRWDPPGVLSHTGSMTDSCP